MQQPDPRFNRHRGAKIVLPLVGALTSLTVTLSVVASAEDPPSAPIPPGATRAAVEAIIHDLASPRPAPPAPDGAGILSPALRTR